MAIGDKESARERATRIWHNARIQRSVAQSKTDEEKEIKQTITHIRHVDRSITQLKIEIRKLFEQKPNNIIMGYYLALKNQRRKLLEEKLRRLLKEQDNG
jgi:hypothetical protein